MKRKLTFTAAILAVSMLFGGCSGEITISVGDVEQSSTEDISGNPDDIPEAPASDFEYENSPYNADSLMITKYTGNAKKLKIPAKINGIDVSCIGNLMGGASDIFNENVEVIIVPEGVTSFGWHSFSSSSSLTDITLPDSLNTIGNEAFAECDSLTSIEIPANVNNIAMGTFEGCDNLTTVTLHNGLQSISMYAFLGCTSLTEITIPDSVNTICDYAFKDCTSLTEITIPDSVTEIKGMIFDGCTSLTSITYKGVEYKSPEEFENR